MLRILLPAYNEFDSLDSLFEKLLRLQQQLPEPMQVVVCDDGSIDGTGAKLELLQERMQGQLAIKILQHKINRGLGETARDLMEYAAEVSEPSDYLVRLDCDDTHEPEFILSMVAQLEAGADVVIASRFQEGGGQMGVNTYRATISRLANLFMKCFFPIKGVYEYSCGYRAYRASIIQRAVRLFGNDFVQLKGLGFTCTLEKLIKLNLLGAKFTEVPFVLRYDQKASSSKMVSSITTLGYLTMTVLYHWPWGGWRSKYKKRIQASEEYLSQASEPKP